MRGSHKNQGWNLQEPPHNNKWHQTRDLLKDHKTCIQLPIPNRGHPVKGNNGGHNATGVAPPKPQATGLSKTPEQGKPTEYKPTPKAKDNKDSEDTKTQVNHEKTAQIYKIHFNYYKQTMKKTPKWITQMKIA